MDSIGMRRFRTQRIRADQQQVRSDCYLSCAIVVDEMCQDVAMTRPLQDTGIPGGSVEALQRFLARKRLVQIAA